MFLIYGYLIQFSRVEKSLIINGFNIIILDFQRKCDLIKEVKDKSNVKQVRRDLDKKLQKFNEQRLQKIALYNELRRKIVEVRFHF